MPAVRSTAVRIVRPIVRIIVLRMVLRLEGALHGVRPTLVHALVTSRVDDPIIPGCSEVQIKGVARHPFLKGDPVEFWFATRLLDEPHDRAFGSGSLRGWYQFRGTTKNFMVEVSASGHPQVRPIRSDGEPAAVRFNLSGAMKVRVRDYEHHR